MSTLNKENEVIEVVENKLTKLTSNPNVIKFKKPYNFEGDVFNEIDLNLDTLTGTDIESAEMQFMTQNPKIAMQTPLKEMSKGFQSVIAAKASKQPVEFFKQLPAADYVKVTTRVQTFLLAGE